METNAENASQPPKKTRSRSKSVSGENTVLSSEEEMAPNLNGNKDGGGGGNENDSATENKQEKQEQHHENPKTRKRKAIEMKLEEDPPEEGPQTPEDDDAKEKEVMKEAHKETSDESPSITDVHPEDESSTNDSTSDLKDIVVPEKNLLGKGKRARIPNKRYSDIPAKYESPKSKSTENGQLQDVETSEILKEEAESDSGSASYSSKRSASSPSGGDKSSKKLKPNVDLNNPNYLKPFQFGWKRELVYRANNDNTLKRNGDIYYYTPSGKKVRSMREVAENLKNKELSIDDFTFFKEPLGVEDPEKEIIRDAKLKTTIVPKKMTPKMAKTPKVTSPKASPTAPATAASETPKVAKSPRLTPGFKVKIPKGSSSKKEKKPKEDTDMEVGTYPPNWSGKKGKGNKKTVETPKSRTLRTRKAPEKEEGQESGKFMETYLQNLAFGYKTLLYVFQYLKVQDLLRAGCVCQMWRDVSRHPLLWSTVRMKNSQIHSFEGLANALEQHGTVHLDLRKMLLPTNGGDDIWPSFTQAIKKVESLRKIELCRCLASVVEDLARNNHNLEVINAVTIKCESMTFEPFKNLKNLTDLRLKSTAGLTLTSDLSALKELTNLKHLSITSIKDLNKLNIEVIGELVNLEVLDIGECYDFPAHFGPEILSRLVKLEKLRLEKGQGECYTFEMLEAVKDLQNLYQLELVNFDIKPGFDRALGACMNIKKLLIIPTYISQSATTNHMVLGGVLKLQKTLSQFVWGVTLELLRVTELFVDQCEQPDKKDVSKDKNPNNGDSIPVLKPVPLHGVPIPEAAVSSDSPQVEILPLPTLQKLLLQNLPTTRVKILKIPFHATWRQSITDSVN